MAYSNYRYVCDSAIESRQKSKPIICHECPDKKCRQKGCTSGCNFQFLTDLCYDHHLIDVCKKNVKCPKCQLVMSISPEYPTHSHRLKGNL